MKKSTPSSYSYRGVSPTLFIGLGEYGGRTVGALMDLVKKRFPPAEEPPLFQFISLGSAHSQSSPAVQLFYDGSESFQAPPGSCPEEGPGKSAAGGGITRHHYRMAFYQHIEGLRALCRRHLAAITSPLTRKSAAEALNIPIDEGVTVYIISSLWESSSTGILWDMATLLREETGNIEGPVRIISLLLYPMEQPGRPLCLTDDQYAVMGAALEELQSLYAGRSMQALPGVPCPAPGKPFHLAYVLPLSPGEEEDEEAMQLLQSYLSMELDPFFSPYLKSTRDQLSLYLDLPLITFGMAELLFPHREIIEWCSRRLSLRALQMWGRKEAASQTDEALRKFFRIMEIKNPEKADEEFSRRMGKPKETAWHLGRQLKELIETSRKDDLAEKFDEEYRRLSAEELNESSSTLNMKMKEMGSLHKKEISRLLLEMASDSHVGLLKLKGALASLTSFCNRATKQVENRIQASALKIDELERERVALGRALKKLVKTPLFFLHKAKFHALFEKLWKVSELSFAERLLLHILTSGLEYYHLMREFLSQYREPVDSLIEVYDLLSKQLNEEEFFPPLGDPLTISFVKGNALEAIYQDNTGSEEKTITEVISSMLSLIPLDLVDLSNKRILRDLRNNALEALSSKARQCFNQISEKPVVEFFNELCTEGAQDSLIEQLLQRAAPRLAPLLKGENMRIRTTVAFHEGTYPQSEASMRLVKKLDALGNAMLECADICDESRISALAHYAGITVKDLKGSKWPAQAAALQKRHQFNLSGEKGGNDEGEPVLTVKSSP
ncbi:MAG: tubulin-like doman-containing protein [Candidatus Eremiobacteraeota bacterium]|nr:tubulin-like doman-containing protein [Candidatus Eremiobacteraeota bacterium]